MVKRLSNVVSKKQINVKQAVTGNYGIQQMWIIFGGAIGLFLATALLTYDSHDACWSNTGINLIAHNYAGYLGAWISDILLYFFGYVAYLLPISLLYKITKVGYQLAAGNLPIHNISREQHYKIYRRIAICGLFPLTAALTQLCLINWHSHLPVGPGGLLGNILAGWCLREMNWLGSFIALGAVFLASLVLAIEISLFDSIKTSKLLCFKAINLVKAWLAKFTKFLKKIKNNHNNENICTPVSVLEVTGTIEPAQIKSQPQTPTKAKPKIITAAVLPKVTKKVVNKVQPNKVDRQLNYQSIDGVFPSIDLLDNPSAMSGDNHGQLQENLEKISDLVETKLADFGITAKVVAVQAGPVIILFELQLAPGVKVSRITSLSKDLARSLSVLSVRVVEVIPGKPFVGLEVPKQTREIVRLKELLSSSAYIDSKSSLSLALGKDISGEPVIVDLPKMPHLLVAGTTGAGKSVGINVMLLSLLFNRTPEDLRLIMIDPKMLELSVYAGIPHLLTEVVTDMKDAAKALRWCVAEMERRYQLMTMLGVRNLAGFNRQIAEAEKSGNPISDPLWLDANGVAPLLKKMPYIVVVIDEFADMIMVVGKKVEQLIARIAQKARAAGIHMILATQRPSVDVITGLIKANIPTRIAFQVSSRIDSRTILDQQGAEQLLGQGDMLYLPPGCGLPMRVHGAFVDDHEVHAVVAEWKKRVSDGDVDDILAEKVDVVGLPKLAIDKDDTWQDPLYQEIVQFVLTSRKVSISLVQRRFKIGYNRSARIIEEMEVDGIVSPMQNNGSREILVSEK